MSPKMTFRIDFVFPFIMSIALFASLSLAQDDPPSHPNNQYLSQMCYPLLTNNTRIVELDLSPETRIASLANSPFPCEQAEYILAVCSANGTTPIDCKFDLGILHTSNQATEQRWSLHPRPPCYTVLFQMIKDDANSGCSSPS
jgi:hypothetical protein